MRGGGIVCGEECEGAGDGTGKGEIGESEPTGHVRLSFGASVISRVSLCGMTSTVCTLHLMCVLCDKLCVHSHYNSTILSPTTISKIGHLRSARVITLSVLIESDQKEKGKKGATECCESTPVIQVYMWGFWFVFSSVLICSAESSMLKFGLFSAAPGKRQILSDCTSQTQFNV